MPHGSLSKQAHELAEWAVERMANRIDACGGYYRKAGKTTPTTRKKIDLAELLKGHFNATKPDHIVGLHSTCPDTNTSKWLAFDIDAHDDKADAAENWKAACASGRRRRRKQRCGIRRSRWNQKRAASGCSLPDGPGWRHRRNIPETAVNRTGNIRQLDSCSRSPSFTEPLVKGLDGRGMD